MPMKFPTTSLFALLALLTIAPAIHAQTLDSRTPTKGKVIYTQTFDGPEALKGATYDPKVWKVEDGVLKGTGNGRLCRFLLPPHVNGENVAIQVDMAILSGKEETRWASLFARHEKDNVPVFTQMPLRINGFTEIADAYINEKNRHDWRVYTATKGLAKDKTKLPNTYRLEVRNNIAKTFINGRLICAAILSPKAAKKGRLGFLAVLVNATFDNVVVEELPPVNKKELEQLAMKSVSLPAIIAHRGFSIKYPENTLEAVQGAIDVNVDGVEVDVRISKDGVPYCLHDHTLDRTTDGTGPCANLTIAELKQLDAGSFKGKEFKGAKIPTFEEVLLLCKGKTKVLVDLKEERATNALCDIIAKHNAAKDVIIATGSAHLAEIYRKKLPECTIFCISGSLVNRSDDYFQRVKKAPFDTIFTMYVSPFPFDPAIVKKMGLTFYLWTINRPEQVVAAWKLGADGIITDRPDMVQKTLNDIRAKIMYW